MSTSPIQFPCDFTLKIMGKSQGDFEKTVFDIIKKHFPKTDLSKIIKKFSKDNNYLSLSVTVYAQSKEALDDCYRDLSGSKEVVMVL